MKSKSIFYCTECGNETPRWQGKCPACGAWNTIVEMDEPKSAKGSKCSKVTDIRKPRTLKDVDCDQEIRFETGLSELDRVLGGGAVKGSLVLVGGAPGIGKSTLLLQICSDLGKNLRVLYVSGEESETQIKLRANRLGVTTENLFLLSETDLTSVLDATNDLKPDVLIVDSIQTLYSSENTSSPGSVSQVKDCTMALMQLAKVSGITVFVVGHVNKEGSIAGPKVLEHMVDCVLYFEGESAHNYRILRAAKNRFGSTNEIGVFEMGDTGLREVPNPSEMLLAGRPTHAPGTCVACTMEGSRPILAEVQALTARSSLNVPKRTTDGFDFNRAVLLMAVLEKRGGLNLSSSDVYINVIGGLRLNEPAADLPVVLAAASSYREKVLDSGTAVIGEVGLTGEIRAVSNLSHRISEAHRLGFTRCVIPKQGSAQLDAPSGMELIRVRNILEAIEFCL